MYAISHNLAHRAPPASRTRVRWQPYSSLASSSSSASSSGSSSSTKSSPCSTPATSVASPTQTTHPTPCDNNADKGAIHNAQNPSPNSSDLLREASASKNKFALGLVDQAVKTLCDAWRPHDIPLPFSNPRTTKAALSMPDMSAASSSWNSNNRTSPANRLSPTSISTGMASVPTTPTYSYPSPADPPVLIQPATTFELRNLVPIRGFVHEVLRRSRTSGCVLQTALCYLEAIRHKIPDLAHRERIGKGSNGEPESAPRIIVASEEEIERSRKEEAEAMALGEGEATARLSDENCDHIMDTVKVEADESNYFVDSEDPSRNQRTTSIPSLPSDAVMESLSAIEETESQPQPHPIQPQFSASAGIADISAPPSSPMAHLPSPLLCPRRAFLAALILASKFTQDKCYSNRAWAKLSGLPPREIGRCERALGCALEWRLWVGKAASSGAQAPPTNPTSRTVVRSQSEPTLNMSITPSSETLQCAPASESSAFMPETAVASVASTARSFEFDNRRVVKRASTPPSVLGSSTGQSFSMPGASVPLAKTTSCTLVRGIEPSTATVLPSIFVDAPTTTTPSPDMPGLSYSPSSASSSPLSSCSSNSDRQAQLNVFFEDANAPTELFNSPVARINTKLLVPGSAFGNNGFITGVQFTGRKPPPPMNFDYTGTLSTFTAEPQGISPQIAIEPSSESLHSSTWSDGYGSAFDVIGNRPGMLEASLVHRNDVLASEAQP